MLDYKKLLGIEEETPVMLTPPQEPVVPSPVATTPEQLTAEGVLGQYAEPRAADYRAPRIELPSSNPEDAAAAAKRQADLLAKFAGLDADYKKNMGEAGDRKLNSEIFAALGNYLPTAVAGAQAMNTKASVSAPKLPTIKATDSSPAVERKYKTDYEGLLNQYKTMAKKDGAGLSAKDKLYASIAQAQLDQGAARLNNNIETTDKNAGIRVGSAMLGDQKSNELSEKQVDSLAGYDDTLTSMARIAEQKRKVDTGPIANVRNKVASVVGIDDPEVTSLRSEVIDTLAAKIKALSGSAASEGEVKRLAVTLPGIEDSDEVFARKLKDAEVRVKEAKKIREEQFKSKQGKNVEGYGQPVKPAPSSSQKSVVKTEVNKKTGQTRLTYSDGTTEVK